MSKAVNLPELVQAWDMLQERHVEICSPDDSRVSIDHGAYQRLNAAIPAIETAFEELKGLSARWRESATEIHESSVWQRKEGHMDDEEYARCGVHVFQWNECADELDALLAKLGVTP